MFDSVAEGIAFTDLEGHIIELNNAAVNIYGIGGKEEIRGKSALDFIPVKDQPKAVEGMRKTIENGHSGEMEFKLKTDNGRTYNLELNCTLLTDSKGNPMGFVAIFKDITERKHAEITLKKQLMKYDLEEGNLYLVMENTPVQSLEAFQDALRVGLRGLVISRTPEKKFPGDLEGTADFLWISEKGIEGSITPDPGDLEQKIENLEKDSVVLIDRLDYLITKNNFNKILSMVHKMRDIAYLNDYIIIISIDPSVLNEMELRQLEKESMEMESRHDRCIPEDLLELLRYVAHQNRLGVRPTYSNIGKELGLSKPTVRKRVRQLAYSGYVVDLTRGRSKIVELTDKGRNFIK
jgi:PAS domain S-box-containing protein